MSTQTRSKRSGILAIMKKEFTRFFTDKRMVLSTVLLPGLMIFVIYSFIGSAMSDLFTVSDDYESTLYAVNLPASVQDAAQAADMTFTPLDPSEVEATKESIANKETDLLAIFPADFDERLSTLTLGESAGYAPPQVELYYNSTRTESSSAFGAFAGLLDAYRSNLFTPFSVNATGDTFNLASDQDAAGFMFAMMLPMLMMMFLFSGCMSVAPESIAGEKERGTIATLLVTPLKRWEMALGKVVSLSCIALLSGASSFIGVMLSLPRMFGDMPDSVSASLYSMGDYVLLLVVVFSTVLLFVGLITLISAYAKTIKEANTLVMPLMIVVMLVGVLAMFSTTAQTNLLFYLIPAYNSVQCMVGVFSFAADPLLVLITVVVNVVIATACVVILTKMFNSEKVVFAR